MSEFLDLFEARQIGWKAGRPLWMTLTPLRYRSDRLGAIIHIPAEFVTDGASVPRLPLVWLVAGGRGLRSSALHDYPYQTGYWLLEGRGQHAVPKDLVDAVFHESLLADPISGAGPFVARQMWLGVRLGGRGVWAHKTRSGLLNPIWTAQGWPRLASYDG